MGLLFRFVVLSFLVFGFGVQLCAGRLGCWAEVVPKSPTELDEVGVIVDFLFYTCPPYVKDFGEVCREGNVFSVNVTIWIPLRIEDVAQVVHNDNYTYWLGRLEAGDYSFRIYVQTIHGSSQYWLEREVKFTVNSVGSTDNDDGVVDAPELPNIGYVLVLLALTSVAAVLLKVLRRRR